MTKGIIIYTSSNLYKVAVEEKVYSCMARGKFKKEKISPLVGDKVEITISNEEKQEGVLEKILPRDNNIHRPKMANITKLVLIVSMNLPKPDFLLLDKQLVFAEILGITPIICFNKMDLVEEKEIKKVVDIYKKIGYEVFITNAKDKNTVKEIKECLIKSSKENQGELQIIALAGNSGVGKSTLLNELLENKIIQEGEISTKNQRGKNTTTSVTLYPISDNTYLADTPGFSTFEISEIEKEDLASYFKEFVEEINCKFIGCSHIKEEKCGVKKVLEQGKISQERYQNYIKIYEELKKKEEHKW